MPPTDPGQSESAFIGYAVVTALLDHLVKKNVITDADVTAILGAAVKKLSDGGALIQKRGASIITEWMAAKK